MAKVTPDAVHSNPAAPVPVTSLNYRPRTILVATI
jgi:hypothetical protein